MTGEVTDRFNGITLFGMDLVWQKSNEFFTSFIIHFLMDRVERLFNSDLLHAYLITKIGNRNLNIFFFHLPIHKRTK